MRKLSTDFSGQSLLCRLGITSALFKGLCLFLVCSCTTPSAEQPPIKQGARVAAPSVAPSIAQGTAAFAVDLPALVGLTAQQIKDTLNGPFSDKRESINEDMHTLRYQRSGYEISIDYEVKSQKVLNFYFVPLGKTGQKYEQLLQAGRLDSSNTRYRIDPLDAVNGLYEGLVVIPDTAVLSNHH